MTWSYKGSVASFASVLVSFCLVTFPPMVMAIHVPGDGFKVVDGSIPVEVTFVSASFLDVGVGGGPLNPLDHPNILSLSSCTPACPPLAPLMTTIFSTHPGGSLGAFSLGTFLPGTTLVFSLDGVGSTYLSSSHTNALVDAPLVPGLTTITFEDTDPTLGEPGPFSGIGIPGDFDDFLFTVSNTINDVLPLPPPAPHLRSMSQSEGYPFG